jgi:protein required for attachment to host cells
MEDTIEELLLSRRSRGNLISYCYESKWNLSETERHEQKSGEISSRVKAMPQELRERIFDYSNETYDRMNNYVLEKAIAALALIKPNFPKQDLGRVWNEAHGYLRTSSQKDVKMEEVRREMIFAQAVNAFLRHL